MDNNKDLFVDPETVYVSAIFQLPQRVQKVPPAAAQLKQLMALASPFLLQLGHQAKHPGHGQ